MNKIKFLLPLVVLMVYIGSSCNSGDSSSSSTSKDTIDTMEQQDTTLNKDSINVAPENFSEPH